MHKPDTQTALTALWVRSLAVEAGLPEALWQVVLGDGPEIGGAVVEGGDYVCFTGSTRVGREVAEKCARRLVGCSLELGGKNPMIVLADADLDRAAEGAVRDCFANSGQLCVSMERIYVVTGAHDEFVDRFVRRVKGLELGTALDYRPDMGSLISAAQLERVSAHVDDAVAKGATVLAGGRARPDVGPFFYEPTILTGVTEDMRLCREETFGPVVAIREVADETEAVKLANDSEFGLNATVWTRDVANGRRIAAQIETGTVSINETYAAPWGATRVPMGGRKDSGLGRRHGREGILKYTEPQIRCVTTTSRLRPAAACDAGGVGEGLHGRAATAQGGRPAVSSAEAAQDVDYDVIVVGSGFGGSVTALRLTEKGYRVGVIEAGRRFADDEFAATSWDVRRFLWAPQLGCYGIQRIHRLPHVTVLAGAGVGGGSLVYANTLYEPNEAFYDDPQWRDVADWRTELRPYYALAKRMLGVVTNPTVTPADEAMKQVAEEMGVGHTFTLTPVGVFFGTEAGGRTSPSRTRSSAAQARRAPAAASAASA